MTTLPAVTGPRTRFYLMRTYYLKQGTQLPGLHEQLSRKPPAIVLEALVAAHMPQLVTLQPFAAVEEALASYDPAGPNAEYEHYTATLLAATDYSPELEIPAEPPAKPRIFELRQYHSPTWRQLAALHERFAGPEIKIFHRVGVHPILYSQTVIGPNMPNLTYLIPFTNLAEREKAWDAFGADTEWIKVRKESIERHGQIASVNQISLFRAAPYSPIR